MKNETIPLKVVRHLAEEAFCKAQDAMGEAKALSRAFPDRGQGVGLDVQVLIEKLEASIKFIELLR